MALSAPEDSGSEQFFPGFEPFKVRTSSGITINGVIGRSGPPILLLHGAPDNLASWRKMTPEMAKKYTIVDTDLRGDGDTGIPYVIVNGTSVVKDSKVLKDVYPGQPIRNAVIQ